MTLSTMTYYGGNIPDPSQATPGLFDRRFSILSQNIDQINSLATSVGGGTSSVFTNSDGNLSLVSVGSTTSLGLASYVTISDTLYITNLTVSQGNLVMGGDMQVSLSSVNGLTMPTGSISTKGIAELKQADLNALHGALLLPLEAAVPSVKTLGHFFALQASAGTLLMAFYDGSNIFRFGAVSIAST